MYVAKSVKVTFENELPRTYLVCDPDREIPDQEEGPIEADGPQEAGMILDMSGALDGSLLVFVPEHIDKYLSDNEAAFLPIDDVEFEGN